MNRNNNNEDFRLLFELCSDLFCIIDQNGFLVTLNDSWTTVLGYSREELCSRPLIDFIHPEDVEATHEETAALTTKSYETNYFENRYRKRDGSYVWLAWSARSWNGKVFAYAKEISKLKRNEAFLATIQSQVKIGGWIMNVADFKTTWTEETYHIHEVPVGTPTNAEAGINFCHPDEQDKIRQYVRDCIEKKLPYDAVLRFITAKGRHLWVRATGQPLTDDEGNVTQLIGTFQDVDSLKLLTETLGRTTSQLHDVLTNSPGMVYQFQLDPDGKMYFTYASPQAFEIYEISAEEFKADPSLMLTMTHPDEQAALREKILASAQTLQPFEWAGRIQSATNKTKWIKARSIPRKLESGSILWNGIVIDTTKEVELEKSLAEQRQIAEHSARLASIGQLAAGVGHEINNPLTIIIGNLERLSKILAESGITPKVDAIMKRQIDACERIRKIVSGMRRLAHVGRVETERSSDLSECVLGTIDLVADMFANDAVTISVDVTPTKPMVETSSTHVQQILMNLLSNAKDAALSSSHPKIQVSITEHLNHYTLCVSDNGPGISAVDHPKIFSAFFSTKDVGKGTGLGLALSKSIIESYGGKISFQSSESGAQFFVDFPKYRSATLAVESHQVDVPAPETLRTLVVDDEEGVRDILADTLREHNCNVVAVGSAESAIDALKRETFDIIFTDIKMPGTDGFGLIEAIRDAGLSAQATKIVMTGGVLEELLPPSAKPLLDEIDGVLNKPFVEQEVLAIINRVRTSNKAA